MWRAALSFFSPRSMPLMTRQSYRYELVNAAMFPIAMALSQAEVVKILADKAFGVSGWVFTIIATAPLGCNLTSLLWAKVGRGIPKVKLINTLQFCIIACLFLIAMLQPGKVGGWLLAGIVILCATCGAGIVTLRSMVWRMNYRRDVRGRVTSRLAMTNTLVLIVTGMTVGALLNNSPHRYQWVYPIAGLIAMVGVLSFRKVRMRHEKEQLKYERGLADAPVIPHPDRPDDPLPPRGEDSRSHRFWSILNNDPAYRSYMICQFLVGSANMMLNAVLPWMISHVWQCSFLKSMIVLTVIRQGIILTTMPVWAAYLDKYHVTRVRARQGWFWTIGLVVMGIGAAQHSLVLVAVGAGIVSIAFGGGALAWNLGHNDFASRRMVASYMAVHVTLAGIRGLIAPGIGMLLYSGWHAMSVGGLTIPGWSGIDYGVYFVAATLALVGSIGYYQLDRKMHSGQAGLPPSE